jgi:hypothetical protein
MGKTTVLGLYRANSDTELHALLSLLPLYQWMNVTAITLEPHPNDPATAGPVIQRDPPPPSPPPPAVGDPDIDELRRLGGLPMDALLSGLDALDPGHRSHLKSKIRSAWGVDFARMEVAFNAVAAKGSAARDFAFDNYAQMRQLTYRDQREALLRFIDPAFKPPSAAAH